MSALTEDQARSNVCCRDLAGKCCGSECMAWRWDMAWESQTEEGHGGDVVVRLKRRLGSPKLGYCGLAGKPE